MMGRGGDGETAGTGRRGTRRRGDGETRGRGDAETGGRGARGRGDRDGGRADVGAGTGRPRRGPLAHTDQRSDLTRQPRTDLSPLSPRLPFAPSPLRPVLLLTLLRRSNHETVSGSDCQVWATYTHSDLSALAFGQRYLWVIPEAVLSPELVGHRAECSIKVRYILNPIVPPSGFFGDTSHVLVSVFDILVVPAVYRKTLTLESCR